MHSPGCDREPDVLQAAATGCCDSELRDHIARCSGCGDLFEVGSAVIDERNALMREAHVPTSGLVWWRTNMRARQEAARTAVRTAMLAQGALILMAIITGFALLGVSSVDLRGLLGSIMTSLGQFALPMVALGAFLILAPMAVYFAVTEE